MPPCRVPRDSARPPIRARRARCIRPQRLQGRERHRAERAFEPRARGIDNLPRGRRAWRSPHRRLQAEVGELRLPRCGRMRPLACRSRAAPRDGELVGGRTRPRSRRADSPCRMRSPAALALHRAGKRDAAAAPAQRRTATARPLRRIAYGAPLAAAVDHHRRLGQAGSRKCPVPISRGDVAVRMSPSFRKLQGASPATGTSTPAAG